MSKPVSWCAWKQQCVSKYLVPSLVAQSQQVRTLQISVSAKFVTDSIAQRDAIVIGQWCGGTSRQQSSVQGNCCRILAAKKRSTQGNLTCYTMLRGLFRLKKAGHAWVARGVAGGFNQHEIFRGCRRITCVLPTTCATSSLQVRRGQTCWSLWVCLTVFRHEYNINITACACKWKAYRM